MITQGQQVAWLAQRHPQLPPRYVLLGGLANEEVYRQAFSHALAALLPTWGEAVPVCSPTEAALRQSFTMS